LFKRYIFQKGDLKKEKERAERADKLKTQFIANMSHEIRTPMNGIIGFTELLKDDSLSREEKDKYIGIIQNSGQRMISILNDLIKISMLDSEQESVNILPVSLNGLCHNVRTFFKMDTEKKGITMICSQEMEKDLVVYTDRDKLYAIVNNLVKNAIKYSSGGVIEFSYQIDNGFIQFNIKDQGIGIEKELQEKIFDRFYQVDSNLNKQYDGVGLGLAIVKSYTELLGGKIWVESSLGKGSTFSFTIPYSQMFS
jgi:signal transduction histidine kinase